MKVQAHGHEQANKDAEAAASKPVIKAGKKEGKISILMTEAEGQNGRTSFSPPAVPHIVESLQPGVCGRVDVISQTTPITSTLNLSDRLCSAANL